MTTVPAKRLKFPVQMFPPPKPISIGLIRLMCATDDVRHLRKLLIVEGECGQEASQSERLILEGELAHLFRLMCGHLCEAMRAFAELDKKCQGQLDAAMPDDRAEIPLALVRQAYTSILSKGGHSTSFIRVVRNLVAFHYDRQKSGRALENHEAHLEGRLVLSPHQGLGRYVIADQLVKFLIADEMGWNIEEFQQKYMDGIGEAIDLAGAFGDIVDYLITGLIAKLETRIEQYDEQITTEPAIERARGQVEEARGAGHQGDPCDA